MSSVRTIIIVNRCTVVDTLEACYSIPMLGVETTVCAADVLFVLRSIAPRSSSFSIVFFFAGMCFD